MITISGGQRLFIPNKIVVHLGKPEEDAENLIIFISDYIKCVASRVSYPTWPEGALRAIMYAIHNFALNRVHEKWYRKQGFDFDITNDIELDLPFRKDGVVYDNLEKIAEELTYSYLVRRGSWEPIHTPLDVTNNGVLQWGAVLLAEEGYRMQEILEYYYGDDVDMVIQIPTQAGSIHHISHAAEIG
ncbi:MAG: hypothetical protein GX299_02975 [Epulopiscium sp.]|jgi:hypothetical protein|nr:hypothetical protein [Candidatus Epulonipiscium sp.]